MGKRFSRYKFALTAVNGAPPTGTPLEKYKKYKAGDIKPTYTRSGTSNPGTYKEIILAPFSCPPDTKYAAQMSKRAFDKMADLVNNAPTTLFHHLTKASGDTININPGFVPARAVINVSGTGTANELSKITGVAYKKETGAASYTIAFGAQLSAGDERFFTTVMKSIKDSVRAKNSEYTVTFTPERFMLN